MENKKKKTIQDIVDKHVRDFACGFERKFVSQLHDPCGIINMKKNNRFIAELGEEFIFYSAFVRSFDSSLGKVLEKIGNEIAKLSYEVHSRISSFLLTQQAQHIDYIMAEYEGHREPMITDYNTFVCMIPRDVRSNQKTHETDHYFYHKERNEYYLIELKSGGDLDNKKAKTEKIALLQQYFLLKNALDNNDVRIKIFFGTAYNKNGEGMKWKQERVKQFFANDELLIGKDYWNFVCDDPDGYDMIMEQYRLSVPYIDDALHQIKAKYFTTV